MRRHNYEQFAKNKIIGLIKDCVYYAWQNEQITDEEEEKMRKILNEIDISNHDIN